MLQDDPEFVTLRGALSPIKEYSPFGSTSSGTACTRPWLENPTPLGVTSNLKVTAHFWRVSQCIAVAVPSINRPIFGW